MPQKQHYTGRASEFSHALYESALAKLMNDYESGVHRLEYSRIKVCAGLLAHMNSDGQCYPSRTTLAKICGVSPNTVTTAVAELENKGFLRVNRVSARCRTKNFYQFVNASWAKTMTWTSGDNSNNMNIEQEHGYEKNWVDGAFEWLERNVWGKGDSQFAPQIRNACDQRSVDDKGKQALLNFSNTFPEVPFVRGLWMGLGNANVETLVALHAYDIEVMNMAVEMRRNMLAAMGEPDVPPAHPLQLQSFLAQAVAVIAKRRAQNAQAQDTNKNIADAGYAGNSDLDF